MDVDKFKDMTSKEIAANLQHVWEGNTSVVNTKAQAYFQAALNKELIDNQKEYQDNSIKQTKHLVYATWGLAIITALPQSLALIQKIIQFLLRGGINEVFKLYSYINCLFFNNFVSCYLF